MASQLTLRDVLLKLGFAEHNLVSQNPALDFKLVIEDPFSDVHTLFKCDGVFVGDSVIHLHMGDEIIEES